MLSKTCILDSLIYYSYFKVFYVTMPMKLLKDKGYNFRKMRSTLKWIYEGIGTTGKIGITTTTDNHDFTSAPDMKLNP